MQSKKFHRLKIISYAILVLSVIFLGNTVKNNLRSEFGEVLGDTNFWQQTDWSGGVTPTVIHSDVNTFGTSENIKFDNPGVIQVAQKNDWATGMDSWKYRNKITINNTDAHLGQATEPLIDFPVIVKLENGQNFDHSLAKTNGEDLRFVDSDGTLLVHEIETWNISGVSYIWVKIPEILQNSDTDNFFVYYGNDSATDNQQPQAVWSDNYLMVYHLNEPLATAGAGSVKDSTENTAGTPSSGVLFGQEGVIGKSTRFTGSTGISLGLLNGTLLTPETTVSFWLNSINIGTPSRQNPFGQAYGGWGTMTLEPNGTINWFFGSHGYDGSPYTNNTSLVMVNQLNTWIHITGVRNPNDYTYKWYKNGQFLNGGTYPATYPVIQSKIFNIGDDYTNPINGRIDEFRVHSSARSASWIAANYKNETNDFLSYLPKENIIFDQGSLTSNIYDTGYPSDWGTIQFTKTGDVTIKVRTSNSDTMDGASDWSSCNAITTGSALSENNCVNDSERYIQFRTEILGSFEPIADLQDVTIGFSASDQIAPDVNASGITIQGLQNSGDWHPEFPVIEWTAGQDNLSGNGLLGYCLSIDEAVLDSSNLSDPALTGGILSALNDGVAQDYCPYIVTNTSLNAESIIGLDFVTGNQYYISIKAVDIAGNIYNGDSSTWQDLISFKYDNTPPTAPFYISLPANFLSSKDVVITWPVGVGGADDADSGLAGLQYRVGDAGIWYGDLHTGTQDITDLLINDGSYVTNETYDYPSLSEGNNLIYFRAVDNVGNVTQPENYVKGILKLNTVAPSPVRNLAVNPISGDDNSYTFSWDVPSTYTGSENGLSYCYAVNSVPSVGNCTYTEPGVRVIGPDAFATQPGENTMYVVAKDEAGNINFATYSEPGSSVTFTYSGSAPGIAQNLDVADISVKATQNWRLVLSWDRPDNVGAGIAYYNIYRSETASSCSSSFTAFIKVGSSTSTSYIDPDLQQKTYNYCIKACDSANNCSASSGSVGRLPTGKFTEPAELLSPPEVVSFTTRKAVINWITDRVSDSSIQYGLETGVYFEEEISNSLQIANHTIALNNLQPGTTYFYRAKWTDVDGNTGVSEEKTFATLPPPRVLEVKVGDVRTDSALVTFTVNAATSVDLLYGSTLSYGGTLTTATSTIESTYTSRITNLNEDSVYNFKFILRDIEGNDYDSIENHRFTTLPIPRVQDIQVQEVKNSAQPTVEVNWTSNVPISTQVNYYPLDDTNQKRDKLDTELKTEHLIEISELQPNRRYGMIITGRDAIGNQAQSDEYQFTTAADSRPPSISNIKVETRVSNTNSGEQAQTQLIVTWDTDEEATSQIEYGEGSGGTYTQRSLVDDNLTFNHLVIVNNLRPSSVYHFRVVSADSAGNESSGKNVVTITAQVSENPLDIIISRLTEVFGFIR